jgi:hypothetical protein
VIFGDHDFEQRAMVAEHRRELSQWEKEETKLESKASPVNASSRTSRSATHDSGQFGLLFLSC